MRNGENTWKISVGDDACDIPKGKKQIVEQEFGDPINAESNIG